MTSPKVLLSWSSGKDSAWVLHILRQQADLEFVGLLTTFNEKFDRVAMHPVRRELVEAQAAAVGLPLADAAILADLPCGIDPCGEWGEFHTFCYRCPEFSTDIPVTVGDLMEGDGFCFCKLSRSPGWQLLNLAVRLVTFKTCPAGFTSLEMWREIPLRVKQDGGPPSP
jgi:diphthamide synthase (EF-2-diphthine--ammonia ligase)